MRIWQNQEAKTADGMVDSSVVVRKLFGAEDMISVQAVREVILGEVCPICT